MNIKFNNVKKELKDYSKELKAHHKEIRIKLGDSLAFIFRITGIKALVKWIYPNCGCDRRQKKLNDFQIVYKIKRK